MMEGWKEYKIKDIGKVVTGNTPPRAKPEFYGNHTLFVKPTDIDKNAKYTYNPEECYSKLAFEKYKNSLIPEGATCVVTIGSIGEKMTKAHCNLFINQAMNAIIPFTNFDHDFVFYLLKHNLQQVRLLDSGTASGRENVSKSSFSNIKVKAPVKIEVQRKIAKILSAYDDLIENNLKRIKLLEEMAQITYEEWFVRFKFPGYENAVFDEETGLPEGWKISKLNNQYSVKYGKNLPQTDIKSSGKYEVFGASGIMGFYSKKNVANKTVLITSRGNGSADIHRTYGEAFVTNNSFIVTSKNPSLGFVFTLNHLRTIGLKNYCSGSAQPQLTNDAMKNIKIKIPNEDVLGVYNTISEPLFDISDNLRIQNQHLKEARDILLPRLMTGMIDVEKMTTIRYKVIQQSL